MANEAAFTPNATETPDSPASTPPRAGPRMICRFRPRESSALACGRDCSGTSRRTAPLPAGVPNVCSSAARITSGSKAGSGGRVMARAA